MELVGRFRRIVSSRRRAALAVAVTVALVAPIIGIELGGSKPPGRKPSRGQGLAPAPGPPTVPQPSRAKAKAGQAGWPGYAPWRLYTGPDGPEGNDPSFDPSASANGRWIAFDSASSNMVRADTNRASDVFVKDRASGSLTRVSASSSGRQSNGDSHAPSISADGRYVAFVSTASNLVAGDSARCPRSEYAPRASCRDVFVHDQLTGSTVRVSVSSRGVPGNSDSDGAAISADGRFVAFASEASNLVQGDTNGSEDIFVRDIRTRRTVNVSSPNARSQANGASREPSISGNGRYVAFVSDATNLVPASGKACGTARIPQPCRNVYLFDGSTGRVRVVASSAAGSEGPAISGDGRYIAFISSGDDLVPGDTNRTSDVFLYDVRARRTTRVSVSSAGRQSDGSSGDAYVSRDGRFIAFTSRASNLAGGEGVLCRVPEDNLSYPCDNVYVRDRVAGTTELVSVSTMSGRADDVSWRPVTSADGRYVAFASAARNLTAGPHEGCGEWTNCPDVFVRDRTAGTTRIVSVSPARARTRTDGDGPSGQPSVSKDGSVVAFFSRASNLTRGDTNGASDIFAWRRGDGIARVSVSSAGDQANGPSGEPAVSAEGDVVAFTSEATNLVPGDTNGKTDVFVRDMSRHRTIRVSVSSNGRQANGSSSRPRLSGDGRFVVFLSEAANLVPGDTNGVEDVLVHDLRTGTTELISIAHDGGSANADSFSPSISADGNLVSFGSAASNLTTARMPSCETTDGQRACVETYLRDRPSRSTVVTSVSSEGEPANEGAADPVISGDGSRVAFASLSTNLGGGNDETLRVYVRALASARTLVTPAPADMVALDITGDGRSLIVTDPNYEVWFVDLTRGTSATVVPCGGNNAAAISADGRYVALASDCVFDGADRNGTLDVYLSDRETRRTTWISRPLA